MASINGLEIKNIKEFFGHEGENLYQGELYLNGKHIGKWSQDAYGGMDNFIFEGGLHIDYWKFNKLVKETHKPIKYMGYELECDLEMLMEEILTLQDYEEGFCDEHHALIFVVAELSGWRNRRIYYNANDTDAEIIKKVHEVAVKDGWDDQIHRIRIFRSSDDFNIGEPYDLADITKGN